MDPYNRILRAAKDGRGVRLTADEVWAMSRDAAIEDRATALQDCPRLWDDQTGSK